MSQVEQAATSAPPVSWPALRKQALLGALMATEPEQGGQREEGRSPTDALLLKLSQAFVFSQGARVEAALRPTLAEAQRPAPAPQQTGALPYQTELLRGLLQDISARDRAGRRHEAPQLTVALYLYMAALSHHQRVLPAQLIASTLSCLLAPLSAQMSPEQLKERLARLPIPRDVILSVAGPRGRWLIGCDPVWKEAFPTLTMSSGLQRLSPEELAHELEALSARVSQLEGPSRGRGDDRSSIEEHAACAERLDLLLVMSHPSVIREALKGDLVQHISEVTRYDLKLWLKLSREGLIERIDSECRM